jgi:hypothetical protein
VFLHSVENLGGSIHTSLAAGYGQIGLACGDFDTKRLTQETKVTVSRTK